MLHAQWSSTGVPTKLSTCSPPSSQHLRCPLTAPVPFIYSMVLQLRYTDLACNSASSLHASCPSKRFHVLSLAGIVPENSGSSTLLGPPNLCPDSSHRGCGLDLTCRPSSLGTRSSAHQPPHQLVTPSLWAILDSAPSSYLKALLHLTKSTASTH